METRFDDDQDEAGKFTVKQLVKWVVILFTIIIYGYIFLKIVFLD